MKKKKLPKWRENCQGYIEALESEKQVRELIGSAIKYILEKKHWDFNGELDFRKFKDKSFEESDYVRPMINAFLKRNMENMNKVSDLNECCKKIVYYESGLKKFNCSHKIRKKRMTRFKKEFIKQMKFKFKDTSKPDKGIIYFTGGIRDKFLISRERN